MDFYITFDGVSNEIACMNLKDYIQWLSMLSVVLMLLLVVVVLVVVQ